MKMFPVSQFDFPPQASGTGGVMALGMAQRYMSTGKFMPAGLVAILGAACCAYNAKKGLEWAPSKSGKISYIVFVRVIFDIFLTSFSCPFQKIKRKCCVCRAGCLDRAPRWW